jgi:hypothetical protein
MQIQGVPDVYLERNVTAASVLLVIAVGILVLVVYLLPSIVGRPSLVRRQVPLLAPTVVITVDHDCQTFPECPLESRNARIGRPDVMLRSPLSVTDSTCVVAQRLPIELGIVDGVARRPRRESAPPCHGADSAPPDHVIQPRSPVGGHGIGGEYSGRPTMAGSPV